MFFTYPGLLASISELSISGLRIKLQKDIDVAYKLIRLQAIHIFMAIADGSSRSGASGDEFRLQEVEEALENAKEIEHELRELGFSKEEILKDKRIVHANCALDLFDLAWGKVVDKDDSFSKEIRQKRQEIARAIMYKKRYSEAISKLKDLVIQIKTTSPEDSLSDFMSAIVHFEKYLEDYREEL